MTAAQRVAARDRTWCPLITSQTPYPLGHLYASQRNLTLYGLSFITFDFENLKITIVVCTVNMKSRYILICQFTPPCFQSWELISRQNKKKKTFQLV